ncbi:MAG: hypothetical protein FJX77_00295 [Armatimonadetes bacterium]|nr:hypothetical protein [Armatimonadota bacterium]
MSRKKSGSRIKGQSSGQGSASTSGGRVAGRSGAPAARPGLLPASPPLACPERGPEVPNRAARRAALRASLASTVRAPSPYRRGSGAPRSARPAGPRIVLPAWVGSSGSPTQCGVKTLQAAGFPAEDVALTRRFVGLLAWRDRVAARPGLSAVAAALAVVLLAPWHMQEPPRRLSDTPHTLGPGRLRRRTRLGQARRAPSPGPPVLRRSAELSSPSAHAPPTEDLVSAVKRAARESAGQPVPHTRLFGPPVPPEIAARLGQPRTLVGASPGAGTGGTESLRRGEPADAGASDGMSRLAISEPTMPDLPGLPGIPIGPNGAATSPAEAQGADGASPPVPEGGGSPPTSAPAATPTAYPRLPPLAALTPGMVRVHPRDGSELVWVPPGQFSQGSLTGPRVERPMRTVRISEGFWLSRTEVTCSQFARFLDANPNYPRPRYWEDMRFNAPDQPVVGVTWGDAGIYAQWLGGWLPTEAEWEYAARGRRSTTYPWGRGPAIPELAVFGREAAFGHPEPSGRRDGNASWCGALDLAGNVWEWCADWFAPYGSGFQTDPRGPLSGRLSVIKGGGWASGSLQLRAAGRRGAAPESRDPEIGFRVAISYGALASALREAGP